MSRRHSLPRHFADADRDVLLNTEIQPAELVVLEPVARALGLEDELIETDALVPDADPKEILREIGKRGFNRAMVVGHMPHLGRLLGYLVTGRPDASMESKKAALARVEFDGDAPKPPGTLTFLLTAKELSRRSKT